MLLFGENVLWLLVLIGVMIMIHELGHYFGLDDETMHRIEEGED